MKKTKNIIPDCIKHNNVISTDFSDTVKLFADYSSSVYVNSTLDAKEINTLSSLATNNNHINLSSWSIDPNEIFDYLNSLYSDAGTGTDGIPAVFLKFCSFVLINPVYFIFNKSLSRIFSRFLEKIFCHYNS